MICRNRQTENQTKGDMERTFSGLVTFQGQAAGSSGRAGSTDLPRKLLFQFERAPQSPGGLLKLRWPGPTSPRVAGSARLWWPRESAFPTSSQVKQILSNNKPPDPASLSQMVQAAGLWAPWVGASLDYRDKESSTWHLLANISNFLGLCRSKCLWVGLSHWATGSSPLPSDIFSYN